MMDDEHQQIGPESAAPRHIPQHDRSPRMPAPDLFAGVFDVRACRVCGCTDDHACPPMCSWVEEDLCSACATARCCDLHNRNCEPPSELCCSQCTEAAHPKHRDGSSCIAPDLSANELQARR